MKDIKQKSVFPNSRRRKVDFLNKKMKIKIKKITMKSQRSWNIISSASRQTTWAVMLLFLYLTTRVGECHQNNGHPSISQISPKSSSHLKEDFDFLLSGSSLLMLESTIDNAQLHNKKSENILFDAEDNETRKHERVERSASPILNENFPKTGPNDVHTPDSAGVKEAAAGRYFQYNIKPTGTFDNLDGTPQLTKRARAGKTLQSEQSPSASAASSAIASSSFLSKGDLRPIMSGSPISPTSSSATSTVASATAMPNKPRQNPNPDIQDIITGIVKLLNGNVNVHANTQGIRRPTSSRINNRGPPRINDVPPLPIEYDNKKGTLGTSIRPPPYPFDRPDRPFITGVPIPEQIVPYRPGFISNQPPWHRNKPRPPITTTIGGRRPIHQYKPMPPNELQSTPNHGQQQQQQQQKQQLHENHAPNEPQTASVPPEISPPDPPNPTDSSYDSEFSSEDANAQYIEVSDNDSENGGPVNNMEEPDDEIQVPEPTQKKQTQRKKKPEKNDYTTIVATSSEVHTVMNTASTYLPMPMDGIDDNPYVEPSTEEVIFVTATKTPSLHTVTSQTQQISDALDSSKQPSNSLSSSITTSPIVHGEHDETSEIFNQENQFTTTIHPSLSTAVPSILSTTETSTISTIDTSTKANSISDTKTYSTYNSSSTSTTPTTTPPQQYHPRPGIVLDDPEFKPGVRPRPKRPQQTPTVQVQPTRHHLPPGYGEIFDVTLSAIQGPGTLGGSQQTINIKPYGSYGSGGTEQHDDIIVSASDAPVANTAIPQMPISGNGNNSAGSKSKQHRLPTVGAGYGVSETEIVEIAPSKKSQTAKPVGHAAPSTTNSGATRPHYRQRPTPPPVRIDTCIVGDDSTCDQAQHEHCKTEAGVSSCHCRPGYSRRKHREPCRKVISFHLGMRVDRIYEHRIVWDNKLLDRNSEPYGQLSYESIRAIDSAMSMTPYSDEFMEARVNNIYRGDPNLGGSGVFVNLTIKLDESVETLRPNLRSDVQKHLLGVLHRRNNNIGNSVLYVSSPEGAVSALHDLDECQSSDLNDCHPSAICTNSWGTFRCACEAGFRDPWADQPQRAGRNCQTCSDAYCNNHGTCSFTEEGNQVCNCDSSHYGGQCEIDGEVLGVAIGASVAAVIIIVLTLVCLIMWSRRWQREQKNALGSPVFGYMNTAPLKSAALAQPGYQVTLEDRMRWAQIADVMAQTNHYGAEPIGPTRPSSALFAAYPNLQAAALGMGTLGGMSMQSTLQMHQNANMAPPVPLPRRLGLSTRSNGMRTLENSSSSEEEDRTDLLGRNFQVPRPKSRSNGSIANQSGIYYDVDYEPSGNGVGNTSIDHLYGSQNQSSSHSHSHSHSHGGGNGHGMQGIPMSTYTSGRTSNNYFMK